MVNETKKLYKPKDGGGQLEILLPNKSSLLI